jgi:hypothetical protein
LGKSLLEVIIDAKSFGSSAGTDIDLFPRIASVTL